MEREVLVVCVCVFVCVCVYVRVWRVRESGEGFSNGYEGGEEVGGGGELELGRGGCGISKNWGGEGGC